VISWWTKHEPGVACSTMITASHNAADWNGFKIKETFGGSALPETTKAVEEAIRAAAGEDPRVPSPRLSELTSNRERSA